MSYLDFKRLLPLEDLSRVSRTRSRPCTTPCIRGAVNYTDINRFLAAMGEVLRLLELTLGLSVDTCASNPKLLDPTP